MLCAGSRMGWARKSFEEFLMRGKVRMGIAAAVIVTALVGWRLSAGTPDITQQRNQATKAFNDGNYNDAYKTLRALCLNPANDPHKVGDDLHLGLKALRKLGRIDEFDEFLESTIAAHKKNWRLLAAAAKSYGEIEHFGFIVGGKFSRGPKRGGANYTQTMLRDRVRALQLMQEALPFTKDEKDKPAVANYHLQFAGLILYGAGYNGSWRLQYLTDLSRLPDFDEVNYGYGGNPGAPVDADGNPVYHYVPKSWEAAETDGQRWRWNLVQAMETDPSRTNEVEMTFANFIRQQLGVQTMAYWGFRGGDDDSKTGTFALHTLKDDETIARLATGVKRFKIPDEFNWIKIYERVANRPKSTWGEQALGTLASEFEDRRQYVKAANMWQRAINDYGPGNNNWRQERLQQIVGNWGRFEYARVQSAGGADGREAAGGTVDFRFRNGTKVSFEAHAILVPKLLNDVKAYLAANPGQINWNEINIGNIGYRIVEQNQQQYLGEKVAAWDLDLKPRPEHVDDRITVKTPMTKPGAYLLVANMQNGNTSRIIIWLADTAIVKKQLDNQVYYYVADAKTGTPVADAQLEFFGWRSEQVKPNVNQFRVVTTQFNAVTDKDGQVIHGSERQPQNFQWLITARKVKGQNEDADRFAYLGFTNVWYNRKYDPEYNQTRVFTITDRPVYRPDQVVHWKAWVRHSKYDQPDVSDFAGQNFTVRLFNPQNDKVFEKDFNADAWGGLESEYYLPRGTKLGVYRVEVWQGKHHYGGGTFRVEEYKKPEFEVTIESPKEPVRLGEKVPATIQAKYYFGAPVVKAKVKYKVMRQTHSAQWFPRGDWDWYYGAGYWWFSPDYVWYPGFTEWCGCRRPWPWWWGQPHVPPELVMENEVEIGPDGLVNLEIDTLPAKELHGNQDHQYTITAEVTDESRRTIVGTGTVLVSRKAFQVYTWLNSGHFRVGDTIHAYFSAQTIDRKPVEGKGVLTLYKISYNDKNEPVEKAVQKWDVDTNVEGRANQQIKATAAGQYRLSYKVTDKKQHTIEGGYLFLIRGEGTSGKDFRFNDVELIVDKREYQPGDKVKLLINNNQNDGTVLLFVRPTNGVYQAPKVIRLKGKSVEEQIEVVTRDMPNFFVEVLTVHGGRVHTEAKELVVPPEKRILNVEIVASKKEYKPGEKAAVQVRLTDLEGKPFIGSTVLSVYDKSVEYISGGSNVPEIKEFFWKWRRHHHPSHETNLAMTFHNLLKRGERGMSNLGIFGATVVEELKKFKGGPGNMVEQEFQARDGFAAPTGALAKQLRGNADMDALAFDRAEKGAAGGLGGGGGPGEPKLVEPTVRKNFADTAYWNAALTTDKDGKADVTFPMPEQLTGWKIRVWGMGHGTKVGEGSVEVVTKKDLIVRLQAPRFFTEKDEVVLSANVHNYLKKEKKVRVALELPSKTLQGLGTLVTDVTIPAGGEQRVDWRVKVVGEGEAVVRMKALSDEDSDAVEMRFPCYVHGMLKMESFTGVIRAGDSTGLASLTFTVPAERRINETRLEVRYSPTLAGAMVDALPYLVDYPYGCTEQTLNRFLPTVITQKILLDMKLDLKEIQKHQVNLNSQEIGNDKERIAQWKRAKINPVFDIDEVKNIANAGVQALANMQLSDGGWGWFSGYGERSWPHTTAVVVHGLQLAKANGVVLPPGMLERGTEWLKNHQADQIVRLQNYATKTWPWKQYADATDALVYMVLVDANVQSNEMRDFLYRDRNEIPVYGKALYGLALHKNQEAEKLAMIMKNIDQYVVEDNDNQTAYLRLPVNNPWWYWYGSEIEANAYYLKLLALTNPKDQKAPGLVKYLLNNRKHATYWNSTRDTAVCIEAMADYLRTSGEDRPDMTVEIWLDGKKQKEVKIDSQNLFSYDNKLIMVGDAVETGKHTLEIKRKGTGPVYFNAYLTNFTLEDFITKAGLEVKVERKYYKLTRIKDAKVKVPGSKNQVVDQKVERFERTELKNLAELKSGDLVEIELEIESKNDYEYLIFEDPKAAGFEPVTLRSGYQFGGSGLHTYMEMRDEKVCFFVRHLPRGKHSLSYKMRAEIPGFYSALPTRAYAMYAPELKGNSDELKLTVHDR